MHRHRLHSMDVVIFYIRTYMHPCMSTSSCDECIYPTICCVEGSGKQGINQWNEDIKHIPNAQRFMTRRLFFSLQTFTTITHSSCLGHAGLCWNSMYSLSRLSLPSFHTILTQIMNAVCCNNEFINI